MCALFRWIFFIFPLLCPRLAHRKLWKLDNDIYFIFKWINSNLQDIKSHSQFTYMLCWFLILWWWFLRSAFKHHFNRFSETFTEYCKKYCSLQQNKEQRSGGWRLSGVLFIGTEVEQSTSLLHMMQTRWGCDGDGQASFVLHFNICLRSRPRDRNVVR